MRGQTVGEVWFYSGGDKLRPPLYRGLQIALYLAFGYGNPCNLALVEESQKGRIVKKNGPADLDVALDGENQKKPEQQVAKVKPVL